MKENALIITINVIVNIKILSINYNFPVMPARQKKRQTVRFLIDQSCLSSGNSFSCNTVDNEVKMRSLLAANNVNIIRLKKF